MKNSTGPSKCWECNLTIYPGDLMHVSRFGKFVPVHKQCVPGEYGVKPSHRADCGGPQHRS